MRVEKRPKRIIGILRALLIPRGESFAPESVTNFAMSKSRINTANSHTGI